MACGEAERDLCPRSTETLARSRPRRDHHYVGNWAATSVTHHDAGSLQMLERGELRRRVLSTW
ncbi:hypothetical protein PIIN_10049 [Serendipita indica DSM 11827]|uniref:Uncharacterized protein n=1 Tax=Serendipita indica (strain DSM 11827) TaxID=1109443 RepID=G4TXK6_SERID|nr:hypothetical protein PIIN_10049 [Serendipita indica DSM 11827]